MIEARYPKIQLYLQIALSEWLFTQKKTNKQNEKKNTAINYQKGKEKF